MNKKTLVALLFFSTLVLIFGIFDHEDKYLQKKGNIFGTTFSITVKNIEDEKGKQIEISLKYFDGKPAIKEISRISKPGMRVYSSVKTMPNYKNNMGISILSTSKGVMTNFSAKNANIGGEVLCRVY